MHKITQLIATFAMTALLLSCFGKAESSKTEDTATSVTVTNVRSENAIF